MFRGGIRSSGTDKSTRFASDLGSWLWHQIGQGLLHASFTSPSRARLCQRQRAGGITLVSTGRTGVLCWRAA